MYILFYFSAEMVKHFAKDRMSSMNTQPMDPSVPSSNDASWTPDESNNGAEMNPMMASDNKSFRSKSLIFFFFVILRCLCNCYTTNNLPAFEKILHDV